MPELTITGVAPVMSPQTFEMPVPLKTKPLVAVSPFVEGEVPQRP